MPGQSLEGQGELRFGGLVRRVANPANLPAGTPRPYGSYFDGVVDTIEGAVDDAIALDRERAEKGPRGPLHGIPIVLKDNYDTVDMPTTAASVAMAGFIPPDDAYQVRKLRAAGAVFIGKTNLHEFARRDPCAKPKRDRPIVEAMHTDPGFRLGEHTRVIIRDLQ